MYKFRMYPNSVETRVVKSADNVPTGAAVGAGYINRQAFGVCGILDASRGTIVSGASQSAVDDEWHASFVSGVVEHFEEILIHEIDTLSFVIGLAFFALTIKLAVSKVSHEKTMDKAAMAMSKSAMSARPYSRALYTMFAKTVAKITQIIQRAISRA